MKAHSLLQGNVINDIRGVHFETAAEKIQPLASSVFHALRPSHLALPATALVPAYNTAAYSIAGVGGEGRGNGLCCPAGRPKHAKNFGTKHASTYRAVN